ncbi:helix-turn-helix transcriptional regulator [Amaricoccus tamworthensis]|uniref:helix-turn-helix transcriptional regulator n=1 Tax=Amaricoccus tamworthensis TaxID=57002 RepID=UPI003C7C4376
MPEQLNRIIDLLDSADSGAGPDAVRQTFVKGFQSLGADFLNIGALDRQSGDPVWLSCSMRTDWIDRYVEMNYQKVDPFLNVEQLDSNPLRWKANGPHNLRDTGIEKTRLFFDELAETGYGDIMVVPTGIDSQGHVRLVGFGARDLGREIDDPVRGSLFRIYSGLASARIRPPESGHASLMLDRRPRLSPRERDVLCLLAEGQMNARISERLGISEITVRKHLTSAKKKLNAVTREHAVAIALTQGLIHP